jgi:hypothetical protein
MEDDEGIKEIDLNRTMKENQPLPSSNNNRRGSQALLNSKMVKTTKDNQVFKKTLDISPST